jgi:DNA-binding CsgD family transcriptional regulator
MPAVVGREAELAALHEFVAGVDEGARALVLVGEAGMGKTTLWDAGVTRAEERGLAVLRARPSESETALSFSAVRDLLDPVLERALEPLPAAQRRAISRALVLDDDEGPTPDAHAVGVALLNGLRALAEPEPIVVAVDDVQWLDAASGGAVAYAARRLRAERIGLLLSRRSSLESPLLAELQRALPSDRLRVLDVGPLDTVALGRIVRDQLDATLPRPLLAEVREASGGNPFFALEIVRTLRRTGASVEAGQPLPVPDSLHELVDARLLALPAESRAFVLAASAHANPTVAITEAASAVDRAHGLGPALEARVVELEGERIRFTHPLLSAAAYQTADPLARKSVHARLAELLDDPEARAWQLAAATGEPDESVAAVLEDAARRARDRGAPRPAALLLDRAGELTPSEGVDDAFRRSLDAAYLHYESGDSPRADEQLTELTRGLPAGTQRARALVRLARVRSYGSQREAAELFAQAIGEAGDAPDVLAVAHEGLAACLFRLRERLPSAVEHAALAAALARDAHDDALAAEALGTQTLAEGVLGLASAADTAARALELQPAASAHRVIGQPLFALAVYRWWADDHDFARDALLELINRSEELGDEGSLPYLLVVLGQWECTLGDYEAARERAVEGQELARQSGQRVVLLYCLGLQALVDAHRGRVESARAAALEALAHVADTGGRPAEILTRAALGHLELALGSPAAALEWVQPMVEHARREGFGEPSAMPGVAVIEALIELGRQEEARALLDWYEGHARRLERVSALANCARCRGLLDAQGGDLEAALAAFEVALAWHAKVELPLDHGRTLLALGATQRRLKRRREARATLDEALAIFERIGAVLWAERARAELKRISGRAPTPGALTPAEERVAELVAEGKTNKEVAAALFLSDRTVEGHLSHVFGKLGIRHRSEVAGALQLHQTQGIERSDTGDTPVSALPPTP